MRSFGKKKNEKQNNPAVTAVLRKYGCFFRAGRFAAAVLAVMLFVTLFAGEAKADGGLLEGSVWEVLFQTDAYPTKGLIQSVCVTDDYIVTIENTADSADYVDIVTAYYKNDHDRNGNPVEQYSVANTVAAEEWEHGNGMCYNPNTNEIYVSLYTNTIPENIGTIYVMDPDTLTRKGSIKVLDDCNILAIDYNPRENVYYIQTSGERGYSVMILDSNFQVLQDLGPESTDPGYNFQDFCVEGDIILQFPLTLGLGIGEFMTAFSLSQNTVVDMIQLHFDELGEPYLEPESVARLDDSSFIVAVNATAEDNTRRCVFYRAAFPNLPMTAAAEETAEESMQTETAVQSESPAALNTPENSLTEQMEPAEVSVTKGSTPLTITPEKPAKRSHRAVVVLLIILAAAAAGMALYLRYVRAERARRQERIRARRRIAMAKQSRENDEDEFDEMLYRDFANLYDLESRKEE